MPYHITLPIHNDVCEKVINFLVSISLVCSFCSFILCLHWPFVGRNFSFRWFVSTSLKSVSTCSLLSISNEEKKLEKWHLYSAEKRNLCSHSLSVYIVLLNKLVIEQRWVYDLNRISFIQLMWTRTSILEAINIFVLNFQLICDVAWLQDSTHSLQCIIHHHIAFNSNSILNYLLTIFYTFENASTIFYFKILFEIAIKRCRVTFSHWNHRKMPNLS